MTIMTAVKHEVDTAIREYLTAHGIFEQLELTAGWSAKLVGTDSTLAQLGFERIGDEWQLLDFGQGTTDDREALARGGDAAEYWLNELGYRVRWWVMQTRVR